MSRADLAEAVNLWLYEQTGKTFTMDANQVGKYERGENRWPHRHYRQALCAVLNAAHPTQLGFYPVRTPSVHGAADALLALPAVEELAGRDGLDGPLAAETGRSGLCTPDRRQVVKLIAALVAAAVMTPAESDAVSVFGDAIRYVIDDPAVLVGHETIADRQRPSAYCDARSSGHGRHPAGPAGGCLLGVDALGELGGGRPLRHGAAPRGRRSCHLPPGLVDPAGGARPR
ncbi:MAG: hypothetical protein KJO75_15635 [Dactylosporangium sp.]|nr:hypothetical protein [Dactylosporangium sp.]